LQGGFNLLESTVAIFMVVMGISTFGSLAVLSKKLSLQTQFRHAGLTFARKQLDVMTTTKFTRLVPGARGTLAVPVGFLGSLPVQDSKLYRMKAEYVVTSGPSPTLRQVTIYVTWRNKVNFKGTDKASISQLRLTELIAMQPPDPYMTY
jgi:hypothetical protein